MSFEEKNPYDEIDGYFVPKVLEILKRDVGDLDDGYAANIAYEIVENMNFDSDQAVARILWLRFYSLFEGQLTLQDTFILFDKIVEFVRRR